MKTYVTSFSGWINENYTADLVDSLPNYVILKRVVMLKDLEDFDQEQPGQHWVLKKDEKVLDAHRAKDGSKEAWLITAKVPKELIDRDETIRIRREFPMEREIALKNKGRGADIIGIDRFTPKGEENPYIMLEPDFDLDLDFSY